MKSYLLTGSAGFVGAHLGNRLQKDGNHVHGIDSFIHASQQPVIFPCERGDVRQPELLLMRAKSVDAIIHLAAVINVDFSAAMPEFVYDINLQGTLNVLETARKLDIPVVYASSSEIYGTLQDQRVFEDDFYGISETHPLDAQSPYAASKIAADRACRAWSIAYGMKINVVRSFNTFGPWQADDGYGGVIAKFAKCALEGTPMPIFGTGEQRRDYLWIEDAVDAYVLALSKDFDGPVNFGTGTTVSVNDIAREIHHLVNPSNIVNEKSVWEHVKPRAGEVDLLRCDASKARAMGWVPKVSFQDGLKRYVDWARGRT